MLSMGSGIDLDVRLVELKVNNAVWMEIFKSQPMQDRLKSKTDAIADAANDASSNDSMDSKPFGSDVKVGNKTAMGIVFTHTPHGYNAKERILDALGAGGD